MHALCHRPHRIACSAPILTAGLCTTVPRSRDAKKYNRKRTEKRWQRERGKEDVLSSFERLRHDQQQYVRKEEDVSPEPRLRDAPSPRTLLPGSIGTTTFSFNPSSGEKFVRSDPTRKQLAGVGGRLSTVQLTNQYILGSINKLEESLHNDPIFDNLDMDRDALSEALKDWKQKMESAISRQRSFNPDYDYLKKAFSSLDNHAFWLHVRYLFYGSLMKSRFTKDELADHKELADLKYPTEWFPATRSFRREFHLHVGPTNSGKTYQALKRLEQAESGIYAGPLRLLAHEVFMRLNAKGRRCNLVTGDEKRAADDNPEAPMTSCTVEMVPLSVRLDVAVIDEIQMIGSTDRGWAWTQAVLGVMAKEVHCCGEERAIPIMQELAAMCGEKLHIHRYKRLSPLEMADEPLNGNLKKLQKGDCLVCFSIMEVHAMRQAIEKAVKTKVAVIYGSLPPETRAQQAKLFNDPDSGYDILVASNAIGMGLNLSIRRLIFAASSKFNGAMWSNISVAEAKQIGGRAGRYSTAAQDIKNSMSNLDIVNPARAKSNPSKDTSGNQAVGYVTTLDKNDFPVIQTLMAAEPEPLVSAGIQPPTYIMERFARQFPARTPFAYLLIRLNELGETASRYFKCDLKQAVGVADCIESIENLTTTDRLIFCAAPIEPRKIGEPALARAYARFVAESRAVRIVDVEELDFGLLDEEYEATRQYLGKLESFHKGVIIWNWLSYRFTGVFTDRPLADHVKSLVENRIEETLKRLSFDFKQMRKAREASIRQQLARARANEQELEAGTEGDNEDMRIPEDLEDTDIAKVGSSNAIPVDKQLHEQQEKDVEDEMKVIDRMIDGQLSRVTLHSELEVDQRNGSNEQASDDQTPLPFRFLDQSEPDVAQQDETLIEEGVKSEDIRVEAANHSEAAKQVDETAQPKNEVVHPQSREREEETYEDTARAIHQSGRFISETKDRDPLRGANSEHRYLLVNAERTERDRAASSAGR